MNKQGKKTYKCIICKKKHTYASLIGQAHKNFQARRR